MTQKTSKQTTERIELMLTEKTSYRIYERKSEGFVYFKLEMLLYTADTASGQVDKSWVLKAWDINLDVISIQ